MRLQWILATELTVCYLGLANLPTSLDRFGRYDAMVWRQVDQVLITTPLCLASLQTLGTKISVPVVMDPGMHDTVVFDKAN
jgi:hypothetical protein